MSKHDERHPLAGKKVHLKPAARDVQWPKEGQIEYRVEDYWDRIAEKSWMYSDGNPAALKYAIRSAAGKLPLDDEVIYGKVEGFGHLVHVSELGDEME